MSLNVGRTHQPLFSTGDLPRCKRFVIRTQYELAGDLAFAARDLGVEYRPRTRVTRLLLKGNSIAGVATDQGDISSPVVIVATGQWTKPLLQTAGIEVPLQTEYHEVCILKNPPTMKRAGCACIDYILSVYFRSEGHDKTLVGSFTGERGIDPDNFPQLASQESLAAIGERACQRIPALHNAELVRGVTGVYDLTPDSRALLGELPQLRGLYVVAGFSGMGFKISPAIGVVMSELLLEGRASTVDLTSFRPTRFAEGKPISPEFEYAES